MSGSIPAINASGYTQKMKGAATNERAYCLLWRLLIPYQRMRTRTGVPKMSYGKCWVCARVMTGDSQTMEGKVTCDGCGWVSSKDGSY